MKSGKKAALVGKNLPHSAKTDQPGEKAPG
jgi:hypothetical protein